MRPRQSKHDNRGQATGGQRSLPLTPEGASESTSPSTTTPQRATTSRAPAQLLHSSTAAARPAMLHCTTLPPTLRALALPPPLPPPPPASMPHQPSTMSVDIANRASNESCCCASSCCVSCGCCCDSIATASAGTSAISLGRRRCCCGGSGGAFPKLPSTSWEHTASATEAAALKAAAGGGLRAMRRSEVPTSCQYRRSSARAARTKGCKGVLSGWAAAPGAALRASRCCWRSTWRAAASVRRGGCSADVNPCARSSGGGGGGSG